jgi:hypothetical protein
MKDLFFIGQPNTTVTKSVKKQEEKKEQDIRSKRIGSFAFKVGNFDYLTELLEDSVKTLGLSIDPKLLMVTENDTITVGVDSIYDISFGYVPKDTPVLNLKKEKELVFVTTGLLALEKATLNLALGVNSKNSTRTFRSLKLEYLNNKEAEEKANTVDEIVTVTEQYIKIGYDIIPFNPKTQDAEEIITSYLCKLS